MWLAWGSVIFLIGLSMLSIYKKMATYTSTPKGDVALQASGS